MTHEVKCWAVLFSVFAVFSVGSVLRAADAVEQKAKDVMGKARQERIYVIGIGDSNQRFGGHGWTKYMEQALEDKFGCWGTGLSWCSQTEEEAKRSGLPPKELSDGAYSWWYLSGAVTGRVSWRGGQLCIAAEHPMDIRGHLKFRLVYGTFKDGDGSFHPSVRISQPPWNIIASTATPIKSCTGSFERNSCVVELPTDPSRNTPLDFSFSPPNSDIKGPFFGECLEVENTAKQSGIAYHTLYNAGGQSLYDMLKAIRDRNLTDYFQQIRISLNGDKRCVVIINSGLNDRHEKEKSIGSTGGFDGESREAYRDNLKGLTICLEKGWLASGGRRETIHFVFMPSHPVSTPDDPSLVAYREEAVSLAKELPNASYILLPELVPQREMAEKKYYDQGVMSSPHLSREGYETLSKAVAKALSE
ncbi:MAG: hypothetical protein WC657_08125 [Candidatus Paceibacterota bacterium]|jgi:hypothetical protein